jgi:hypothetical protein
VCSLHFRTRMSTARSRGFPWLRNCHAKPGARRADLAKGLTWNRLALGGARVVSCHCKTTVEGILSRNRVILPGRVILPKPKLPNGGSPRRLVRLVWLREFAFVAVVISLG